MDFHFARGPNLGRDPDCDHRHDPLDARGDKRSVTMHGIALVVLYPAMSSWFACVAQEGQDRKPAEVEVTEESKAKVDAGGQMGEPDRVQIASGAIEGLGSKDGVRVFRGIPFAEPPVGELWWKPPQPVKPGRARVKPTSSGPRRCRGRWRSWCSR